ncbi:enoyl-CoA hydratase-related protein [Mycobacterium sp. CVI_P3]|uniref:Enoyl-CoA hydratase-related protein n=1 Tax=Mycobacterium pinniadriaticum TaxID=2994102 RepID=A0ABT3SNP1_9MYCO|nr:enoyl-CoA hydratase-related protein [Mycobacterium pinniadriaticum]MCX2934738.1 enoyl-CoA hydratase-related protein [Mycobacterium pinniadriaticum]MCX2941160.1 enoyl-CoA hydratase-related protein [Mycobacterium pinniadriaticum]
MAGPFAPELLVEDGANGVRLVTLNRPEALNAANQRLHEHLAKVWTYLAEDDAARAVVITGAGEAFSAGGDMHHLVHLRQDRSLRRREIADARRMVQAMIDCPLPIVAAVNGPAVGLGCNLAILSDVVLIAENAYLADPHVSIGLTAADGGAPIWPTLVGLLRAKEYLLTGDRIPAQRAVEFGLATRSVSHEDLHAEALRVAYRLAAQPMHALRTTKRALNLHIARAMSGILEYALAEEFASFDTEEHQKVVDSFVARSSRPSEPCS